MWWNLGEVGTPTARIVLSMNGRLLMEKPPVISAHALMKWNVEVASANVWCNPTPRQAPPHLK